MRVSLRLMQTRLLSGSPSAQKSLGPAQFFRKAWVGVVIYLLVGSLFITTPTGQLEVFSAEIAAGQEMRPSSEPGSIPLAERQMGLIAAFERLRGVLTRLAEIGSFSQPDRTIVIEKALREAEARQIALRMNRVVELLATQRYAAASEEQESLVQDLQALLELLLAEDRQGQLQNRRKQLEQWLRELEAITRRQKDIRARTARPAPGGGELEKEQEQLGKDTAQLRDSLARTAGQGGTGSPGSGRRANHGDIKPPNGGDQNPEGAESGQGAGPGEESAPGKPAPGEGGIGGKGGPGQGAPSSGDIESPPMSGSRRETPEGRASDALSAAEARMLQAAEKLRRAQRDGALAEQEEALRELERARAELERILRQLRQEEVARLLTGIQARLEKMLALQREIYAGTEKLAAIPESARSREHALEVGRLGRQENAVGWEADQLLLLLREDASAPAMVEAASQLRTDISVAEQLFAAQDIGPLNLSTQRAILAALQEMLDAVRERLEEIERERQDGTGPMAAGASPLVDLLAELRMLRSLQERIRTRSEEYQRWLADPNQDAVKLKGWLKELAARQARLQEIARDLANRAGP
ncbi:MAG: hypothetical protein NZ899_00385 [Thermoguttaceae bacterium]|nr:hypothetical protein [Thermoguttaceae bacterium]MDW8077353.1 hypothetical protein [Thermoguttaceae bacterium]